MSKPIAKHRMASNAVALVTMCELLNKGAHSRSMLVKKCGISEYTAVKWLRILRNHQLIYVERYQRGLSGQPTAYWRWGYKEDSAPRPKPYTTAEYSERYRLRKKVREGRVPQAMLNSYVARGQR